MAKATDGFRIQPGVEKFRNIWQTFKNTKDVVVGVQDDVTDIETVLKIAALTHTFDSWWTEADRPFVFFDLPSFWQVPGQLAGIIYFTEIAAGARTIDISIDTWIDGFSPVVIAGPIQSIIPVGTDLLRVDIAAFAVDLTGVDLLGFFVQNVSNPIQTDYWVPAAGLIFQPTTPLFVP